MNVKSQVFTHPGLHAFRNQNCLSGSTSHSYEMICLYLVETVAQAISAAVRHGCGRQVYQIGDENLTWDEMLTRLGQACGRIVKIIDLPAWIVSIAGWSIWFHQRLRGREGGLDMRYFAPLQTDHLFIDPIPAQAALGFYAVSLENAFKDTVLAAG